MIDWGEAGNDREQYRVGERLYVKSGTAWELRRLGVDECEELFFKGA